MSNAESYIKSLKRIPTVLPSAIDWTDEDREHLKNVITALEKQIPEPYIKTDLGEGVPLEICPRCGMSIRDGNPNYCYNCGQALECQKDTKEAGGNE